MTIPSILLCNMTLSKNASFFFSNCSFWSYPIIWPLTKESTTFRSFHDIHFFILLISPRPETIYLEEQYLLLPLYRFFLLFQDTKMWFKGILTAISSEPMDHIDRWLIYVCGNVTLAWYVMPCVTHARTHTRAHIYTCAHTYMLSLSYGNMFSNLPCRVVYLRLAGVKCLAVK